MESVEEKIRYHQLYDIYSQLLTEKQRVYFEYYYLDDYSLSEISTILDVSRNAVHDQVKIVISHLEHYEETLHLFENQEKRHQILSQLHEITKEAEIEQLLIELEKIEV